MNTCKECGSKIRYELRIKGLGRFVDFKNGHKKGNSYISENNYKWPVVFNNVDDLIKFFVCYVFLYTGDLKHSNYFPISKDGFLYYSNLMLYENTEELNQWMLGDDDLTLITYIGYIKNKNLHGTEHSVLFNKYTKEIESKSGRDKSIFCNNFIEKFLIEY